MESKSIARCHDLTHDGSLVRGNYVLCDALNQHMAQGGQLMPADLSTMAARMQQYPSSHVADSTHRHLSDQQLMVAAFNDLQVVNAAAADYLQKQDLTQTQLTSKDMRSLVQHLATWFVQPLHSLACHDPSWELRYFVPLYQSPCLTLSLLVWDFNRWTMFHDHGDCVGAVQLLRGALQEDIVHRQNRITTIDRRPGRAFSLPLNLIHRMGGVSREYAVSLHAYSSVHSGGLTWNRIYASDEMGGLILTPERKPIVANVWHQSDATNHGQACGCFLKAAFETAQEQAPAGVTSLNLQQA